MTKEMEAEAQPALAPELLWELGTAYDLFMSLEVLHDPAQFGLRGAWAAGVRSRLPAEARELLEQSQLLTKSPFHWTQTLPDPKDSETVLYTLGQIPPAERLAALSWIEDPSSDWQQMLNAIVERGSWNEGDMRAAQAQAKEHKKPAPSPKKLEKIFHWWAHAEEYGERYLEALRTYQEVFFGEEERRILPALKRATEKAQERASQVSLTELLGELSRGLRFEELMEGPELVMAPSFWITPLVFYAPVAEGRNIFIFGARSPEESIVPGAPVPDALLQSLKALSDPTRLRILRFLAAKPHTPAQLARRLRLRPPTVTHHLGALRLAGLVGFDYKTKHEHQYSARVESIARTFTRLNKYLASEETEAAEDVDQNQVW